MVRISVLSASDGQQQESVIALHDLRMTHDQIANLVRNANALVGTALSGRLDGILGSMPILNVRVESRVSPCAR